MFSFRRQGGFSCILIFLFIFVLGFQQITLAGGRSNAGGGDLAKFDAGTWAIGTALNLCSTTVGSYLGNSLRNSLSANSTSLTFNSIFNSWGTKQSIGGATNQIGRAMSMMGSYYDWNPKATMIASFALQSAAASGINNQSFGSAGIGALGGATQGAVLSSLAQDGKTKPWMGFVAGMSGDLVSGCIGNGFNLSSPGFRSDLLGSLVNNSVAMGIEYTTEGIKDPKKRFLAVQAMSGLSSFANYATATVPDGFLSKTPLRETGGFQYKKVDTSNSNPVLQNKSGIQNYQTEKLWNTK